MRKKVSDFYTSEQLKLTIVFFYIVKPFTVRLLEAGQSEEK